MSVTSIQTTRPSRRIGAWTLQGVLSAAFLAAGVAKLTGVPFMVDLFAQIGIGQWFRFVTGAVEVAGAVALLVPGLASVAGLSLGVTIDRRNDGSSVRAAHQPRAGDRLGPAQCDRRLSTAR